MVGALHELAPERSLRRTAGKRRLAAREVADMAAFAVPIRYGKELMGK